MAGKSPKKGESLTSKAAEAAIKKEFGAGVITYLSEFAEVPRIVIPSGSISLDHALGVGGFVGGKMVEFYGWPASGKTTLAWSVAASALQMFPDKKVLFIDVEKATDLSLVRAFGIDLTRVVLVSAETAEENLTVGEILIKTGEFSVTIVDSVAALVPRAEYESTMDDQQIGLHARLMSKMCRNYKPVIKKSGTLLILINQLREKIIAYGDPTTTTGGKAIPFYSDVRVQVSTSHTKKNLLRDQNTGDAIGQKVIFVVTKNKMSPPFRTAEVDLLFGVGFDRTTELFDLAEQMGLLDKSGAWYEYEGVRAQGRTNLKKMMLASPEKMKLLENDIYKVLGA